MTFCDDDARLVQHDVAERRRRRRAAAPVRCSGRRDRGLGAGLGERLQLARGDHLGQHHGGGLQRLLFLLGIGAAGAVLHDQHAERVAGAQERHAEEGVVDLLAGLRPVGEGRVRLRVGEVERLGLRARSGRRGPRPAACAVRWTASRLRPSVAYSSSVPSARST